MLRLKLYSQEGRKLPKINSSIHLVPEPNAGLKHGPRMGSSLSKVVVREAMMRWNRTFMLGSMDCVANERKHKIERIVARVVCVRVETGI